jgi:shikimate dehydrogenase
VITGTTRIIAHLGYPTALFKAPMIYNPWFAARGIDAVVVPMGVRAEDYAALLRPLFSLTNIIGAQVTMPHKVATAGMLDRMSATARIAGACNAIRREEDGSLTGDMFDGSGFVRGMRARGRDPEGARALVVGCGGVGSAIAASLAEAGVAGLGLFDLAAGTAGALAERLGRHYPALAVALGGRDPAGYDIVVNATPLGMEAGDALPFDPARLTPGSLVADVVMRETLTPLLRAARARGCQVQPGTDMLFEMIPAYLEFFGLGTATPDQLREVAAINE